MPLESGGTIRELELVASDWRSFGPIVAHSVRLFVAARKVIGGQLASTKQTESLIAVG
jgi:hypothetical protein